jgi:translation factor GUF1, mitochondrial
MCLVTIVTPSEYFNKINSLCEEHRGERLETTYIDQSQMLLKWRLPLLEVIVDFFDQLKRNSSGYASFDLKDDGKCALK